MEVHIKKINDVVKNNPHESIYLYLIFLVDLMCISLLMEEYPSVCFIIIIVYISIIFSFDETDDNKDIIFLFVLFTLFLILTSFIIYMFPFLSMWLISLFCLCGFYLFCKHFKLI